MNSWLLRALRFSVLVAAAFAGGAVARSPALASTAAESPYELLDQMARVLVLVETEYVEPVDRARLTEGAIKGMVAELDPHSAYMPKPDYAIFQSDTEGSFAGIGVEVDFRDDAVVVIAPIEGSPADHAGVRPGDRILAIDNVSIRGRSPDELVRQMRGPAGTEVLLTIRREGEEKYRYFKLRREVIRVSSIKSKLLDAGIAYLRVKQFQSGTHQELLEAYAKLRDSAGGDVAGVLLDLRNNPGGLVDEASAVADEFLSGGVIYTTRRRGQIVSEVRADPKGVLRRGPVVVLVNEYTASAAELVAGALLDQSRAPVVGTPTFGKGSVQTVLDLPGGAGLRLTTMRYYTPSGHSIQARGVQPSVLIKSGYVPDQAIGVVREADLPNHLPTEGAAPKPAAPAAPQAGAPADTDLGVAREVPSDPTKSTDFQLSVAYQIVTGVMSAKP
jgi:carboxyl-terminal processing protease